jgi:regulator of protease activity HflC (stomatin/prohibitin superfamily)
MRENKGIVFAIVFAITLIVTAILADRLVETVPKGYYQIKQAAVTGEMSAKMTPGTWLQMFGDIETWPMAETLNFTGEKEGDTETKPPIEVRFVDGSLCDMLGTIRVITPTSGIKAVELTTVHSYKTYKELEDELVYKVVRNVLRLTANLMTAQESYSDKRADFDAYARDQIDNGLYETTEEKRKVLDLVSGDTVEKVFKVIKKDENGESIYRENPLKGLGIRLIRFEVKRFSYRGKVSEQIEKQQEAYMAVATARANAQKADQEAKEQEALGKKAVVKARYEKEEEKIRAVVIAQKNKETAEIKAKQELEVAKLAKLAAEQTKQQNILLGEGEAKRKSLVLKADGALKQKLDAWIKVNGYYADNMGKQKWVPDIQFSGGVNGKTKGDNQAAALIQMLMAKTAKDISLDISMPKGVTK